MEKKQGKSVQTITKNVKLHLSQIKLDQEVMAYDENHLKLMHEKGVFRKRQHAHIFNKKLIVKKQATNNKTKDIVPYVYLKPYRKEIIEHVINNDIKLHTYYRHFNSSQGLVLNFLAPIINTDYEQDFISTVFGFSNGQLKIEDRMHDRGSHAKSASEIDFTIKSHGVLHLFEAKYTEQEFGKAKINIDSDTALINKYKDKWFGSNLTQKINHRRLFVQYNLLVENNILKDMPFSPFDQDACDYGHHETFIGQYQLIRNLYNTFFETVNRTIVLRKNPGFMHVVTLENNETHKQIFNRFKALVSEAYKHHVIYLEWQDLCAKAIDFAEKQCNATLLEHYVLFKKVFLEYDH